ncbi:hypothetical protein ABIA27_000102 [Sinorhizobium fredii]
MHLGIWWIWQNYGARRFAKPLYASGTKPAYGQSPPIRVTIGAQLLRSANVIISAPYWRSRAFTTAYEISIVHPGNDNAELVMASR